ALAYRVDVASDRELAERDSFVRGFALAFAANLLIAVATIPIADHWNARGGEEWSVGLVVGSALVTGVLGVTAVVNGQRRAFGAGVLVGALLAPVTVGAVFIWYFAILHGS